MLLKRRSDSSLFFSIFVVSRGTAKMGKSRIKRYVYVSIIKNKLSK